MSRKAVTEAGAVVLMLGVLAHPARAQPIELADAQMDNVTAGAFTVTTDPTAGAITLVGSYNGAPVTLTSTDGGRHFTSTTGSWATQVLYISTTQGFAVGILANGNQYWDGESPLPPAYILTPDRVIVACCGKQPSAPQASRPSTPALSAAKEGAQMVQANNAQNADTATIPQQAISAQTTTPLKAAVEQPLRPTALAVSPALH